MWRANSWLASHTQCSLSGLLDEVELPCVENSPERISFAIRTILFNHWTEKLLFLVRGLAAHEGEVNDVDGLIRCFTALHGAGNDCVRV